MYGIFRISDDNRIVLDQDAVKLIPEIRRVTEEELIYIILVYDWFDSPLRKMPLESRKTMAKRKIWKKDAEFEPESKPTVKIAIEMYKSICYDPTRSSADVMRTKIEMLNRDLLADHELTLVKSKSIIDQLSFFSARLETLDQEIRSQDITYNEIKGKLKLSKLEMFQRRQQEFNKIRRLNME